MIVSKLFIDSIELNSILKDQGFRILQRISSTGTKTLNSSLWQIATSTELNVTFPENIHLVNTHKSYKCETSNVTSTYISEGCPLKITSFQYDTAPECYFRSVCFELNPNLYSFLNRNMYTYLKHKELRLSWSMAS